MTDLEIKARAMLAEAKETRKLLLAQYPYGDSLTMCATLRIETLQKLLGEPHNLD